MKRFILEVEKPSILSPVVSRFFVPLIENSYPAIMLEFPKILNHGSLQENWNEIVSTDLVMSVHLHCSSSI